MAQELYQHPDGPPLARAARRIEWAIESIDVLDGSTAEANAGIASAIALVEIARLLEPLPPEIAEANVSALRPLVLDQPLGLVGDRTALGRAVFVLPATGAEGTLDTRLLRVAVAEQIDQWLDNDAGPGELVDRMERIVRGWVAESNG